MKKIITLVVSVILFMLPVKVSYGCIEMILGFIEKGAGMVMLASSMAEVAGYPSEYVKMANAITDEINQTQSLAQQVRLNYSAQIAVAQRASLIADVLTKSVNGFSDLLMQMTAATSSITSDGTTNADIAGIIADIKTRHKTNMHQLAVCRQQVAVLNAAIRSDGAAIDFVNRSTKVDIYKK